MNIEDFDEKRLVRHTARPKPVRPRKNFPTFAKECIEEAQESWKRIFAEKPHLEPSNWLEKGLLNEETPDPKPDSPGWESGC